ncbi:MAG: NAD(P)/FAD-dependent oxidoreductase [Acidobacteriota bacterium]|nr:NAD(P)/FAD-dependent oxidoreductase [Acidobacteriota bacterium]
MSEIDVVVVGAGFTGLASAMILSERGHSVCVLDTHPRPGMEASTHNSGVVHAGLYYPPASLKAHLCLEGRDALYAFCERHDVPHHRTGKLVIADDAGREAELEALALNARANGARAELLSGDAVRKREPAVDAPLALWSPDTGIVDASQLVLAFAMRAKAAGATVLLKTPVSRGVSDGEGFVVDTEHEQIRAAVVINAAGLFADDVSRALGGEDFRVWACRGDYAELTRSAAARYSMPIYPLPEKSGHGLGVHFTPTVSGTVLLGPTSRYQDSKTDYESDRPPLTAFFEAARKLVPSLALSDLRASSSGIRAKLHPPEETFADFMIRADAREPRLIHAAGIDSPGLTSSLAVGRMVADLAEARL